MEKKLMRNPNDKIFSGVCSGLAKYFDSDPGLVRVLFILIGIATAILPSLIAYIAMAIVLPEEGKNG